MKLLRWRSKWEELNHRSQLDLDDASHLQLEPQQKMKHTCHPPPPHGRHKDPPHHQKSSLQWLKREGRDEDAPPTLGKWMILHSLHSDHNDSLDPIDETDPSNRELEIDTSDGELGKGSGR